MNARLFSCKDNPNPRLSSILDIYLSTLSCAMPQDNNKKAKDIITCLAIAILQGVISSGLLAYSVKNSMNVLFAISVVHLAFSILLLIAACAMFYGLMVIWIAHMLINWYAGVLFTLYMWRDPIKQNYNFIPIEALITILIFTMAAVSQIAAVINGNREHESKPTRPNETTAA